MPATTSSEDTTMNTIKNELDIKIYPPEAQGVGQFDGGRITEIDIGVEPTCRLGIPTCIKIGESVVEEFGVEFERFAVHVKVGAREAGYDQRGADLARKLREK